MLTPTFVDAQRESGNHKIVIRGGNGSHRHHVTLVNMVTREIATVEYADDTTVHQLITKLRTFPGLEPDDLFALNCTGVSSKGFPG